MIMVQVMQIKWEVCVWGVDRRGGGERINLAISLLKFSAKIKVITLPLSL